MDKLRTQYKEMLSKYKGGLSNTSTQKFDEIVKYLGEKFGIAKDELYATGSGTRPGNLEVRLSQGVRATIHTTLGLGFLKDDKNSEANRKKLTNSAFVTITKFLGRGKAHYDCIAIFVESEEELYPMGLIFQDKTSLVEKLIEEFEFPILKDLSKEAPVSEEQASLFDEDKMEGNVSCANTSLFPIIYYGAPGTGKTRYVQEEVYSFYEEKDRVFTTFHQSYSYEEFVEGLKPILDEKSEDVKYRVEKGIFYKACERAAELAGYTSLEECVDDDATNRDQKFKDAIDADNVMLLCIDEINRGNVAAIFGDLISLIEPSKRLGAGKYELMVTLPYSQKKFGVPANLYIVGTMNTADRSIQLLDSALRRRFVFKELTPDYSVFKVVDGDAAKVLKKINAKIRCLLNKDNQIGHSYLMNAENNKQIVDAIVRKIIPLLEEYFYNDINKVRFVLNETDSTKYPFYVEDKDARESFDAYLSMQDIDDEDKSFYSLDESIANLVSEEECGKYIKHLLGEDE